MALRVYNSLTQHKEEFHPLQEGYVKMYVCGITAYDSCHIGHARAAVTFDLVYRYLKFKKWDVTYVRNFTDIDDKIIQRAQATGTSWKELTERYIHEYKEDMQSLGVVTPTMEPRATEYISEMVAAIEALIQKGHAYEMKGSVYYSVRSFKSYGKLSHKNIEELEAGARVEIDELKKDPLDFALWKKAKPGEPFWMSPWGEGRPGWHIECSVMSTHFLGQPFDIHGGGRDLIFPHHENEIAQAEGVHPQSFCHYFLHNGFVNIQAEKMSKSKGNFKTIKEVVAAHSAEVVRYFLLSAHYGSPLDYTFANMSEAKSALDRFYSLQQRLSSIAVDSSVSAPSKLSESEAECSSALKNFSAKFEEAMDDDFNSAKGLGLVFEIVRLLNKYLDQNGSQETHFLKWAKREWESHRRRLHQILGLFGMEADAYFEMLKKTKLLSQSIDAAWVESKIEERELARKSKDFKRSDEIRSELTKMGVELKDRPGGKTEWNLK